MSSRRGSFGAGARAVLPVLVGIIPFGLVAGATAIQVGLSGLEAMGLSIIVFAGASQLAAIELLGQDAPAVVVVVTALVINLRMTMYSASIAPYFRGVSTRLRAGLAYLLTDQAYALSITRFRTDDDVDRVAYYLGSGTLLWVVWILCTAVGIVVGARVPDALPLEFAVPLTFLALLVPAITDSPSALAAVIGGTVATVGADLPLNMGLITGALVGIVAGLVVESRWDR